MPIFFGCYYFVPDKTKNIILFLGSLSFYFVGTINNPEHFIVFILSIILDFFVALWMEKYEKYKKIFLSLGVVFHLLSLITFKYSTFLFGEINKIFPGAELAFNIVLPIGISFYTFQGLSYILDVYKGKISAEKGLLEYTVYISMFEQLIAGPIVIYGQVKKDLHKRHIKLEAVIQGVGIFIFGLGMKVLLANPLGKLWTQTANIGYESISTPLAWLAIVAFSFQIYFDFFGYSLMAIGLGKMLGFRLPKNFDHPYTRLTMTEFWRRWHITLGSWFREYVYIPLGGNRKGKSATIRNLFIVWMLTGIWHGAGYNFVLWGAFLFTVIMIEKFLIGDLLNRHPVIAHTYMILLIPISWAIFAIEDFGQLGVFFTRLFPFFGQGAGSPFAGDYIKYFGMYWPFFIVGILFSTKLPYNLLKKVKSGVVIFIFIVIIFAASVYCMYQGFDDPFLYFRF